MNRSDIVDGVVIGLIKRIHFDKEELYHPEIEYQIDGIKKILTGSIGTYPASYKVGDEVKILVFREIPKDAIVYDFWFRYLPISLILCGAIHMIGAIYLW